MLFLPKPSLVPLVPRYLSFCNPVQAVTECPRRRKAGIHFLGGKPWNKVWIFTKPLKSGGGVLDPYCFNPPLLWKQTLSGFSCWRFSILFPYLVDGGWSVWSDWTQCSVNGKVQRNRSCNNPSPLYGAPCQGEDHQEENCGESHYFQ